MIGVCSVHIFLAVTFKTDISFSYSITEETDKSAPHSLYLGRKKQISFNCANGRKRGAHLCLPLAPFGCRHSLAKQRNMYIIYVCICRQ